MNSGAITKRYATALLHFTLDRGSGEQVCRQVIELLRNPRAYSEPLHPDLLKFVALLKENGRTDYLRRILRTYIDLYCEAEGFKHVRLTSAVESEDFALRLQKSLEQQSGCTVIMETRTDPSLLGGYTVEVDGRLLDASVRRQLQILRRQFIEKNNRIV